jgi:hypothetical protein
MPRAYAAQQTTDADLQRKRREAGARVFNRRAAAEYLASLTAVQPCSGASADVQRIAFFDARADASGSRLRK